MRKIKYISLIILVLLFVRHLWATQVYHQLKQGSDFFHTSTLGACSTNSQVDFSINCNPALATYSGQSALSIGFIAKADGDSIDNGKKLIFDPINEGFLRRLFENDSYNSFSFNSSFTFRTPYFTLEYSPYYLVADIFLYNPAFASMSVNIINRETLRLVSATDLSITSEIVEKIKLGYGINYYKNKRSNSKINLVDLGTERPEDLITFQKDQGISGDLGLLIQNKKYYLPDLSLVTRNIGAKKNEQTTAEQESSEYLYPLLNLETYSTMGIGKGINTTYGQWHGELLLPFDSYFKQYYSDYMATSIDYSLGLMQYVVGASKYHYSFGMNFKSAIADVGIIFAKEKDLGNYADNFKNSVYISAAINL